MTASLTQFFDEPEHNRRFATAADGNVADDDDRHGKPFVAQDTVTIESAAQRGKTTKKRRRRQEGRCA
jgi:hypothetical protein